MNDHSRRSNNVKLVKLAKQERTLSKKKACEGSRSRSKEEQTMEPGSNSEEDERCKCHCMFEPGSTD